MIIAMLHPATTSEPINPTIKGFNPTFLKDVKTVFKPIPASPSRMRNLPDALKAWIPDSDK